MTTTEAKLNCRSVWKLYGAREHDVLAPADGVLDDEALRAARLIVAVRDVLLDVREGEIFVIMGPFGQVDPLVRWACHHAAATGDRGRVCA